MHYDAPENTGQITLKMLQDAYAETLKYRYPNPTVFFCKPDEYPAVKELVEKIFGK